MKIYFDDSIDKLTRIKVMGIGGGGCNAVDRMIQSGFDAVEYICVNTDVQALLSNKALEKIQIGPEKTKGLGAGGDPAIGRESAEENIEDVKEFLDETDILFLLAGFGGGTGTGALPVIAQAAKEMGILTIPVITKPFLFEGRKRSQSAQNGIDILSEQDISIIIVPNEKLLGIISEETSVQDAFLMTDKYLMSCVESLYCLLSQPGLINVDFADVRSVMSYPGLAVLGQGTGEGNLKVNEAVEKALASPILDKESLTGAQGLLIHIRGGSDISLMEVNRSMSEVEALTDNDANIIFGTTIDEKAENKAHVTIIATGLIEKKIEVVQEKPKIETIEKPLEVTQEKPPLELKAKPKPEPKVEKIHLTPSPEPVELELPHIEETLSEEPQQPVVEFVEPKTPEEVKPEEVASVEPEPSIKEDEEPEVKNILPPKPKPILKPRPKAPPKPSTGKGKQIVINFQPGQKGRFEKMEPTLYDGEDLDVPTFIRKKKLFNNTTEEEVS